MKYAILSTDNNPEYYSLLPLVCYSWRKIGYTPVVYTVGVPDNIIDLLKKYCHGRTYKSYPIPGIKDSTVAQFIRLLFDFSDNDNDRVVLGDADMVIAKDIFIHEESIVSYGFDLTGRSEIPMCYVSARYGDLSKLMDDVSYPVKAFSDKWEDYWSVDQQLLTQKLKEYGFDKIKFVDRGNNNKHGLPTGRWDRHDWSHIPDDIIDVHMKRNDWDAQIEVFKRLWPGDDYSFIEKFRDELKQIS